MVEATLLPALMSCGRCALSTVGRIIVSAWFAAFVGAVSEIVAFSDSVELHSLEALAGATASFGFSANSKIVSQFRYIVAMDISGYTGSAAFKALDHSGLHDAMNCPVRMQRARSYTSLTKLEQDDR